MDSLTENLDTLRKKFHYNLSKKRGLLIVERDLAKAQQLGDLELQAHFERLTTYRRAFAKIKEGAQSTYRFLLRIA